MDADGKPLDVVKIYQTYLEDPVSTAITLSGFPDSLMTEISCRLVQEISTPVAVFKALTDFVQHSSGTDASALG